jgi:penicillin-binding protein 2
MIQYKDRKYIIGGLVVLASFILIIRLFFLQVIDTSYKLSASSNALQSITQYPARGLIYDRNGELLVTNRASYDLLVTPRQLKKFDTLGLCEILEITPERLIAGIRSAYAYSRYKPSIIVKQLSPETYAVLQEKLYKYPGFYTQARTLREYRNPIAAHLFGYVGEVDENIVKNNEYYKLGDYIGISGVEKNYEEHLRGQKGIKIYLVDVHNRIKGSFQEGKFDKPAIVGSDINLTIDSKLQEYGEYLMHNKTGSIVAIDPSSGEILALVSAPTYNPRLLVGRTRAENYVKLRNDTAKPLFNRAIMAKYPPGSTFKIINALIGLQENQINERTTFSCHYGYRAGPIFVGCHEHRTPLDLTGSIQCSCNSYYCQVFRKILTPPKDKTMNEIYDQWRNHVLSFGFGKALGSDISHELNGYIPSVNFYNKIYGKTGWSPLTIISLAIGQGELGITPIQMANMAATIANRGYYITPHIVKNIEGQPIANKFVEKHHTSINPNHFELIIKGMDLAVNGAPGSGSTARIARLDSIIVCGKTGTAENPHGDDHSIFIAFAPKDDPKIAIAVYVENSGYGATWAAPIASLLIEKYLIGGETKRKWIENHVLNFEVRNAKKN